MSSIDLLQVKKVKEHIYQKILKLDENANQTPSTTITTDTINSNLINSNPNTENSGPNSKVSSSSNSLSNGSNGTSSNDISTLAGRTIELICSETVSLK